jgi:hypothetical protein
MKKPRRIISERFAEGLRIHQNGSGGFQVSLPMPQGYSPAVTTLELSWLELELLVSLGVDALERHRDRHQEQRPVSCSVKKKPTEPTKGV